MNKIKEKAIDLIAEEAAGLFLKSSISSVTMEEIAKTAGVGAASLYRYFGTKQALAVRSAVILARNVYGEYFGGASGKSGFEQIRDFYLSYLSVFHEKREYFRFVREFDALFLAEAGDGKTEYENEIDLFKKSYMEAYEKGVAEGSVTPAENAEVFYYSTTHALLNLCKDLTREQRVSQDGAVRPEDEIQVLIDIILYRLKR